MMKELYWTRLLNYSNYQNNPHLAIFYKPLDFSMFTFRIPGISEIIKKVLVNEYTKEGIYGQRFTESGFVFNQTLVTLSTLGIIWLTLIFILAPILTFTGVLLRKQAKMTKHGKAVSELLHPKVYLSLCLLFTLPSLLPCTLTSLLEITYTTSFDPLDSTSLDRYSYLSSLALLLFALISIILLVLFTFLTRPYHGHPLLQNIVPTSTLYEPFKNTAFALIFHPLYALKCVLIALILS